MTSGSILARKRARRRRYERDSTGMTGTPQRHAQHLPPTTLALCLGALLEAVRDRNASVWI